jgi:hypothetical protein
MNFCDAAAWMFIRRTLTFLRQPGGLLQNFVVAKMQCSGKNSMDGIFASGRRMNIQAAAHA